MNETKSNAFSILLAIVLIALIWIGVVAIAVLLAFIFDGGQFVLRCILIQPFSIGGVFSTRAVWKYYLQH
jgi:hypothetical protein